MSEIKKYYKKAQEYSNAGKLDLAIEAYKKVLEIDKNNVKCLKELGELYEKKNDNINAIYYYKQMINIVPLNIKGIILNQIGVCNFKISQYEEAIKYFKKVLEIKNDIPDVYNNIGTCYINMKQYKIAEVNLLISLKFRVDDNINIKLGNFYFYTKKYEKSIYHYRQVSNLKENSEVLYNLCFPYLALKNVKIGYELYEQRLVKNNINAQTGLQERVQIPYIPYWQGHDNINNLLIIYEQGIGDNIQYYKYIILLSKLKPQMKITYLCKDIVAHLFIHHENENINFITNINVTKNDNQQHYDGKIYIMSLPFILKIEKFMKNTENYIKVDENKLIYWKNKLENNPPKKLNVGFIYNGLLSSFIEKNIPLQEFKILADLDINLICLHKLKDIDGDLKNITFKDKLITYDIDIEKPFVDTIAILKNIDLLITIDTSIVHLAGVLNVKTLLLLGYGSDWRWFDNNEKVWYESVDIIRMDENKELKCLLPQVRDILLNMIK